MITHETGDLAGYLGRTSALLWPPPARVTLTKPGRAPIDLSPSDAGPPASVSVTRELMVLPGRGRPRLLVPVERRAAAAGVRRYGEPESRATRLATRAIWLAMAGGVGPALFRDRVRIELPEGSATIESYLGEALGREVRLSMRLDAPRANRKPVLQLQTAGGETLGFAKIGASTLTSRLVRDERATLTRLARPRLTRLTVPTVLHYGTWNGLEVLVLGALPLWRRRRRRPSVPRLRAAMGEVAAIAGVGREPVAATAHWRRLGERLLPADSGTEHVTPRSGLGNGAALAGDRVSLGARALSAAHASIEADRSALLSALETLAHQSGSTELVYGSWHGDWTPWNMASTRAGLLVWDWERFAEGVPLGFDTLHHWLLSEVVPGRREPVEAARACIESAAALLAPLGVEHAEARLTAVLYLAELSARYIADRQAEAGARLGAPGRWLIPAITAELAGR